MRRAHTNARPLPRKFAIVAAQYRKREAALKKQITTNSQLQRDFEFILSKLGWPSDALFKRLIFEAGRFRSGRKSAYYFGRAVRELQSKKNEYFWMALPGRARKLADDIERADGTALSPSETAVYRDAYGKPLPKSQQVEARVIFEALPNILRSWAMELKRKVTIAYSDLRRQRKDHDILSEQVTRGGLEECIFHMTGKYHEQRLWRLFCAAAGVMDVELVNERSFVVRLNRQRRRLHGASDHTK